jgi:DDE family transposase
VIIPYRKPRKGQALTEWQEELNIVHKRVRARVEHALAHMKSRNILRCRRKGDGVRYATLGVAHMRNLAIAA